MCAQTGPCLLTIVHHMKEDPELYLSHPEDNLITCYNSTVYLDKEYSLKLNLRHFDLYKVMGFLVCIFFFFTVIESFSFSYLNMSEYGFMSSHPLILAGPRINRHHRSTRIFASLLWTATRKRDFMC